VEIVEQIIQLAKELVLATGCHEPILFIKGSKGNIAMAFKEFGDTADKRVRQMLNAGTRLAYKHHVGELEALVFVDEAWMGTNITIQPSKDPNRVEVLLINTLDAATQEESVIMFKMVRNQQGKIIDLKQNALPENGSVEGKLLPAFQKGYQIVRPTTN
jgi:hypothetical protein